jgi:hypothetical protein
MVHDMVLQLQQTFDAVALLAVGWWVFLVVSEVLHSNIKGGEIDVSSWGSVLCCRPPPSDYVQTTP